jgi:hypothetical protein
MRYDRPVPNLPHFSDTWTVLREEPAPDFAHCRAPNFPTFWWRNSNRPNSLLTIVSHVHWAILLCTTATILRKFRPSLPALILHRVLWNLWISTFWLHVIAEISVLLLLLFIYRYQYCDERPLYSQSFFYTWLCILEQLGTITLHFNILTFICLL